ncbi:hypothetical protein GW17_00051852 [Ensete ventricosum]|nr:hypothetical protein GW17_00051852 [Ensete ventricosum]
MKTAPHFSSVSFMDEHNGVRWPYVSAFGYAGMYVVSVVSLKQGMSHYVLVVYRNAIAAVVVVYCIVASKSGYYLTRVSHKISCFRPVLDQNFYYMGTKYTSASFSSALYNILPAVTFVNAIILRMEKIDIEKRRSQAKIFGTAVTVMGALIMILYKGPIMEFVWTRGRHHVAAAAAPSDAHWLAGTFMLLFSCFCWSAFFILQAYPAELSLSTLICVLGAGQGSAVALFMELVFGNTIDRVIGAVVIVIGLYSLIWGKSADHLSQSTTDNSSGKNHGALELPNSVDFVAIVDIPPAKKP